MNREERERRGPMSPKARLRAKARKRARKQAKANGTKERNKVSRLAQDKNLVLDYKDPKLLRLFLTETGKIIPRRISGNTAKQQREITLAIKRARQLALLPYAPGHI